MATPLSGTSNRSLTPSTLAISSGAADRANVKGSPRSLSGLVPFLRPYKVRIAVAGVFLVMAAVATLVFPLDRKSTRLNSSHVSQSRMPSSA